MKVCINMDISSMLEVQVNELKEVDSKENVTPRDLISSTGPSSISQEEINFYQLMFNNDIASVRYRKLHCTACDVHIGSAPAQANNMFQHPVLRTLLCAKCREFYGDGSFEQGDDATDMFCRWCANGGNLYCCSYCSNTFCYKCIKRNFDSVVRKKIEADEKWKCFVCNPVDLYTARSTCWALLQHVKTVTRILQNDRKMSALEISEKMNFDESQCCPRRRKRKRRRTGSNSEEEDETYTPKTNGVSIVSKRRLGRRSSINLRASLNDHSERGMPALPCEKVVKESENMRVKSSGAVVSSTSTKEDNTLSFRLDQSMAQPKLYNSTIISAVPSVSLLQPISSFKTTHSIIYSPAQMKNSYQSAYCIPTPMVTIPNQQSLLNRQQRPLLPKPKAARAKITPNIIELDSDSDEPVVVEGEPANRSVQNVVVTEYVDDDRSSISTAVPVALVSTDTSYNSNAAVEQPLRELNTSLPESSKTFNQTMLPQTMEIDCVLDNLKVKLHEVFKDSDDRKSKDNASLDIHSKIKQFYCEIRNTIQQLVFINDRVVREYNVWNRTQNKKDSERVAANRKGVPLLEETNATSLDMTCVNDSNSSTEGCDKTDYVINSSKHIHLSDITEDLRFFKKKRSVSRAVGNSSVLYEDKAVQAYDVESMDYERNIGYSLLTKADYNESTKRDILQPVVVPNEYLGKFQEQFIFYLQDIEDSKDDTNELKNLSKSNQAPSNDLIKENSSFISEMLCNIDTSNTSNDSDALQKDNTKKSDNVIAEKPNSTVSESEMTSVTVKAVEELVRMVSKLTNNLNAEKQVERQSEKVAVNVPVCTLQSLNTENETLTAVQALIYDERNSWKADSNVEASTVNEEDCSIIDD